MIKMVTFKLAVETSEKNAPNLLLTESVAKKGKAEFRGFSVKYLNSVQELAAGIETIYVVVEITKDTAVSLFSMWLYDKLKEKKVHKLTIDEEEVELDKGQIEKIIKRHIEENRE
ncbi:MAG: hypothetical protein ABR909_10605 [Candidatus Bathyarchaeia archaeon]|jgi:hypothetical protein